VLSPFYDLARFYREQEMYDASALFSEAGLLLPFPKQDILFLEDYVYTAGLREEYAIAAYYFERSCAQAARIRGVQLAGT
jgi:hypothetical protein